MDIACNTNTNVTPCINQTTPCNPLSTLAPVLVYRRVSRFTSRTDSMVSLVAVSMFALDTTSLASRCPTGCSDAVISRGCLETASSHSRATANLSNTTVQESPSLTKRSTTARAVNTAGPFITTSSMLSSSHLATLTRQLTEPNFTTACTNLVPAWIETQSHNYR